MHIAIVTCYTIIFFNVIASYLNYVTSQCHMSSCVYHFIPIRGQIKDKTLHISTGCVYKIIVVKVHTLTCLLIPHACQSFISN